MSSGVSKSQLKARALELFREVERSGEPIVVTDRGRPVLKVVPYQFDAAGVLSQLRGSVLEFTDAIEPTGASWEAEG